MKLFFAPGACSLSPHIALREAGLSFEMSKVNLKTRQLDDGSDFLAINSKGYVPALQLDTGEYLTEGPAIIQYIADQAPSSALAPAAGTLARYRLQEWLNFITSELHKGFSPLFNPKSSDDTKAVAKEKLAERFVWVAAQLGNKPYLMGDTFTVADGYLFTVLNWGGWVGIDLSVWPTLKDFHARVAARPQVQAALKAEGLLK